MSKDRKLRRLSKKAIRLLASCSVPPTEKEERELRKLEAEIERLSSEE